MFSQRLCFILEFPTTFSKADRIYAELTSALVHDLIRIKVLHILNMKSSKGHAVYVLCLILSEESMVIMVIMLALCRFTWGCGYQNPQLWN